MLCFCCFYFTPDIAGFREALHDLFCAGDIPWFLLPDQPDLGGSSYGVRGAESGHLKGSSGEGGRVSGHAGAVETAAGGRSGTLKL